MMSVRPERRMAESIRSTRFVLSMRSTLPRSALSAQKLNAGRAHALGDARSRREPWSRLPPSAWSDSSTITTTGARARMAPKAFSWLRSDWPTYIPRSGRKRTQSIPHSLAKHSAR